MKVGILGGGQLGMMLAQAGKPLGHSFRCYDPDASAPARIAADCIHEDYHDFEALHRFADGLDVITYEFENVPRDAVEFVEQRAPVRPTWRALDVGQERIGEKQYLAGRGIPIPGFASAETSDELLRAARQVGFPCVVKTCRFGYDGKGQFVLKSENDVAVAWEAVGGTPLIVEAFIPFDRELSIIAARGTDGSTVSYPLVQNTHREGILRRSMAPAPGISANLQSLAERHAAAILDDLDYVGVLTIEFFQRGEELIANEIAPRVHNSGHWTIEGSQTSQFANHVRAITGMPLGKTTVLGHAAMINVIGSEPDYAAIQRMDGVHIHSYGKLPRDRRKLGHVTVVSGSPGLLYETVERIEALIV